MTKKQLSLDALKIKSFVTDIKSNEVNTVKGGSLNCGSILTCDVPCQTDTDPKYDTITNDFFCGNDFTIAC
ncbi:MAG: pinensin family lanthipeptide [Bacteroidota bacterium]